MKNELSSIYEKMLVTEAEKSNLENPTNDTVGKLSSKQDLFGEKPKTVEGATEADVDAPKAGPNYKVDAGSTSKPKTEKSSFKGTAPAKSEHAEEGEEMEDTDVTPESEEEKKEKKEVKEEKFMSAFENLFKKTLTEEVGDVMEETDELEMSDEVSEEPEAEEMETEETDEEGDLVSDLKDLQDKLSAILAKLEDVAEDEENENEEESYTETDFENEFGEEGESEVKEALEKPKALPNAHGKKLQHKNNKVGKLTAKRGKANTGNVESDPELKPLGDKKAALQKGGEAKSTVKKGEFFK